MSIISGLDELNSSNNTVSDWFNKTNQLIVYMRDNALTANASGMETNGDAILNGKFVANTIAINTSLSGGDYTNNDVLTIISNTTISNSATIEDNLTIYGDVTVNGDILFTLNSNNYTNLIPETDGYDLGNTSNRWDGYFNNVDVANTLTVSTLDVTSTVTLPSSTTFSGNVEFENLVVTGTANLASLDVSGLTSNGAAFVGSEGSVNSSTPTVIDSFAKTETRGFKYIIQGDNNDTNSAYCVEIMCAHNDTSVFYTRYAEVNNNFTVTLVPTVNGANIDLTATCSSASVSNVHSFNIVKIETR